MALLITIYFYLFYIIKITNETLIIKGQYLDHITYATCEIKILDQSINHHIVINSNY